MKYNRFAGFLIGLAIISGVFIIFNFQSCRHEPYGVSSLDTVCFETQILPILSSSCALSKCHDAGTHHSGFDATTYANILKLVTPGNPGASKLYDIVTSVNNPNFMPPLGHPPLNETQRTLLEVWIAQGALDTKCSSTTPVTPVTPPGGGTTKSDSVCFTGTVLPIILANCAVTGCHDGTNGELHPLTNYSSILSYVTPRDTIHGRISSVISGKGESRMPPSPRSALSTQQIISINKWISQGALNNSCISQTCDTTGTISFTSQVWPIIQNNCIGCHSSGNSGNNNVNLSSYQQIVTTSIQVQKNNNSLLVGASSRLNGFFAMPPSSSLSTCDMRTIILWVQQGNKNN